MMDRRNFLRRAGAGACALAAPGLLVARDKVRRRPNFIFILIDDLGWSELGCYGNYFNETPGLDRLAAEGVRFTDAYAAAPVCSPYRASLMTGQWPARSSITDFLRPRSDKSLSTGLVTLPEMLRDAGYATGMIGKWHLTGYGKPEGFPGNHGFDEVMVSEKSGIGGGDYFHPYRFNREVQKRLPGKEHLIDRVNLEAVEFIERHREEPFFLYVSHYAIHTVMVGRKDLVAKYSRKARAEKGHAAGNPHLAAQLEAVDQGVGMIMKKLEELGLAEDTVMVFTGDNGGESLVTSNAPLRAGKSWLYEGGIREPLIVRYPELAAGGSVCSVPTSNVDFLPTFARIAGIRTDAGQVVDGVSILPLLEDPCGSLDRDSLYWHYPLPRPHSLGGRSSGAVRRGELKLIEFYDTGGVELYNLAEDLGETNNLAEKMPGKAAELKEQLAGWRADCGFDIPEDCRGYNPEKFFMDPVARWALKNIVYRIY